jgi:phosphatidate phosphatase PAH1
VVQVHIAVNGEDVEVKMRLGEAGEAYFEVDPVRGSRRHYYPFLS